jgi:hypothetical protein
MSDGPSPGYGHPRLVTDSLDHIVQTGRMIDDFVNQLRELMIPLAECNPSPAPLEDLFVV